MNDLSSFDHGNGRAEQSLERKFILILCLQLLMLSLLPQSAKAQQQDNRLEVLLRTANSSPVANVTITLEPRKVALGGPVGEIPARSDVTNDSGWVAFEHVPQGIWLLSFAGSADGVPLLERSAQGDPPYGTTTAGGGFLVAVNGVDGDDIKIEDSPSSGVQQALFTGSVRDGAWVPEYDLGDPNLAPAPLSLVQQGEVQRATIDQAAADTPASATLDDGAAANSAELNPLWICYAPGILLGLFLLGRALVLRRRAVEVRG